MSSQQVDVNCWTSEGWKNSEDQNMGQLMFDLYSAGGCDVLWISSKLVGL